MRTTFRLVFLMLLACIPLGRAQTAVCTPTKLTYGGNICDLSHAFPNSGGTHVFRVALPTVSPSWSDTVWNDWILPDTATVDSGILTYTYQVAPNPSGQERVGRITISSLNYSNHIVVQGANAALSAIINASGPPSAPVQCTPSPSSSGINICDLSEPFSAQGGNHAIALSLHPENNAWSDFFFSKITLG